MPATETSKTCFCSFAGVYAVRNGHKIN
ncbi:hypothetical protein L459_05013, partial [Klebsiella pneumoniae BIDMC 23]